MSKIKITLAVLATCSFAMLTACGDGFKGSKLVGQTNHEQIKRSENEITPGETAPSVDEQAVATFTQQQTNTGNANNQALANQIEAISMTRTDTIVSSSVTEVRYQVRMLFGCDSNEEVMSPLTKVNVDNLRQGLNVSLGKNQAQSYEFLLACTDSQCDETVVTIRKFNNASRSSTPFVEAVVHYGMQNEGIVSTDLGGRLKIYEYVGRRSTVANFYYDATVAWYQEQCLLADAESQIGAGLNSNGIDDSLFGTGTTTTNTETLPFLDPNTTNNGGSQNLDDIFF